jgi:hypothetical protein
MVTSSSLQSKKGMPKSLPSRAINRAGKMIVGIEVSPALYSRLQERRESHGQSLRFMVTQAIEQWFATEAAKSAQ